METSTAAVALVAIATFGFMGSLHCAAMCGPLAASACLGSTDSGQSLTKAWQLLAYHATRVAAYTLLGVAAGLGSALVLRSTLQSLAPYLGILLGAVMLAYSIYELGRVVLALRRPPGAFQPALAFKRRGNLPGASSWLLRSPLPKPVTLGLATALLPCGFLYAALAQAALLAHPFFSGAAMAVFALATGPALLFGTALLGSLGRRFPKARPLGVALVLVATSAGLLARAVTQPHVHGATHDHSSP